MDFTDRYPDAFPCEVDEEYDYRTCLEYINYMEYGGDEEHHFACNMCRRLYWRKKLNVKEM